MNRFRTFILMFVFAIPSAAANKEMIELQRDVATLMDQVRQMNEKLVALTTLMQTTLDNTRQSNVAIGTMQERVSDSLKKQQADVVAPVVAVGSKLDAMSEDFRAVRENVLDMNSRMGKLDAKITDLQVVVQTLKAQPVAPPPAVPLPDATATPTSGTPGSVGKPNTPPPGMTAEATYTNAYRDYSGGSYDLALGEFNDYLKYFPNTTFAPNAQYYIGDIYYRRKDYDGAIQAFDAVLEHFSDNSKTADAHLMKGRSLMALNKRDAAAREFKEIVSRYPDSDAAAKAKTLLKELGLSASSSTKPKPKKKH